MVIINSHNNPVRTQPVATSAGINPQAPASANAEKQPASQTPSDSSVSLLARQLGASATQAQIRDAALDPQSLGQKASQVLTELSGRVGGPDSGAFEGMPRDQLALITYAEHGEFTVEERVSAWQETARQEQLWRQSAATRALDEYSSTGKMTGLLGEALAHFKSLPVIEQAQYPTGYADDLLSKIDLDSSDAPITQLRAASPMEIVRGLLPETGFSRLSNTHEPAADARGRQIMLDRLYGGRESPVMDGAEGMLFKNVGRSSLEYLTKQDRQLLSDIYAYVRDKNVDMTYVDTLAGDLGDYRQCDNGRIVGTFNSGHQYNSQGWQLSVDFTEKDSATASRMLQGSAIASTRLDQGFMRYMLDPGHALGSWVDFDFLEHVVTRFSAEAHTATSLDNQFSTYVWKNNNYVMTTSSTVRIQRPDPDFITENGVRRLTEKGRALGYTLEEFTGAAVRPHLELVRAKSGVEILRQWFGNERNPGLSGRLVSLWERLGKM
ncbi:hypothetical protein CFII64_25389 [Pseudomonas sp. CFII64]|uniref:hypothetical protein n=1 Tax=Pseudomonas sp. CFII64 TaxID=911242 RepID=UPI0003575300|nr:hypothetical protein [Pseudomonas sp. CFII64]EPJ77484.1 hypothetical protein CFII64_25389 [Pseudomonas sp. CFII64]